MRTCLNHLGRLMPLSFIQMALLAFACGGQTSVDDSLAPGTCDENLVYRVSVSGSGEEANATSFGFGIGISADGNRIVFQSDASNLVPGDDNDESDIFVHDVEAGTTAIVSINSEGVQGTRSSETPTISGDGELIVFDSRSQNLVVGHEDGLRDIFVHNMQTGETKLVSVDSVGNQSTGDSWDASISADGSVVVFSSGASNLVEDDDNGETDIFAHFLATGETILVSRSIEGTSGNSGSYFPVVSSGGERVVFSSLASNLVTDDDNGNMDVFVYELSTGIIERISVPVTESENELSTVKNAFSSISASAKFVVFSSSASDLVVSDENESMDVFVRDLVVGSTTLVSLDSAGRQVSEGTLGHVDITADGRAVLFSSTSEDLVPDDENGETDIFLRDLDNGTTTRLSVSACGHEANGPSGDAVFSTDGRTIAFTSSASNLVNSDRAGHTDVFIVRKRPF